MARYCSNCGAKLGAGAKYCHKCGRTIGEIVKKQGKKGFLFLFLSICFFILGIAFLSASRRPEAQPYGLVLLWIAGFFYLGALIKFFKWLLKKNKYVFWGILALFIIMPLIFFASYQYSRIYISQVFEIQDIASEVAYAKSIADDLMEGINVSVGGTLLSKGSAFTVHAQERITSMGRVYTILKKDYEKIKSKKVKPEIELYRGSVEMWTWRVVNASNLKNPQSPTPEEKTRWSSLPEFPEVASINLEETKRVEVFESLVDRTKNLKNLGDNAITNQDSFKMRQVAANALMQSNLIDGLTSNTANICSSRRGCAPEVRQFVTGVYRSANNYVAGYQGAADGWKNTWDQAPEAIKEGGTPLGGQGITVGTPEPTIPPNPTTTFRGFTPFLKPKPIGPNWDGFYSSSANISCDAEAMDYYQSFADEAVAEFEVRDNKIVGSGISIDDSGRAEYFVDLQGVQVSVSYYFSQTQDGAVNLSGDYSINVSVEDASSSCSGTFAGSRTAL